MGDLSTITEEKTMVVRAKMRCASIEDNQVKFDTQYDEDTPENQRFTKYTPWGSIEMGIDNPAALEQFEVGKNYYIDFSPAPTP